MPPTIDGATTTGGAPLRVGIVGAGRRAQGNFLPALACLRAFSTQWIHARTWDRLCEVSSRWKVAAIADLDDDALLAVDAVAVTVPVEQNLIVLRKLERHAARLAVVIDTPIAQSLRDALTCAKALARFRTVLVGEDYMNFPEFELARRAVAHRVIGDVRHITLDGLGYRHHGLALLRSFAGFAPARNTWRRRTGLQSSIVGYRLRGGMTARVIGPYRRNSGTMTIAGDRGTIAICPDGRPAVVGRNTPTYDMRFERTNGILSSLVLESPDFRDELALPEIAQLIELPSSDRSELNLKRSIGLMQVFKALHEDNLNRRYGSQNALYDAMLSRASEKLPRLFDPSTYAGTNAFELLT